MVSNRLNKRITLFCGHYGSGKTNIAVNFAIELAKQKIPVSIADIDIVNPYFRTKDSIGELEAAGVDVVALPFANTSVDLPAIPSEVYGLIQRRDRRVVMDIGGDDRGAYALGRFADKIKEENNFDMVFVVNFYRPLTPDATSALEIMREIEAASKIPFSCIINNSNIGELTRADDIRITLPLAEELSEISGLPIVGVSAKKEFESELGLEDFLGLSLQKKIF